MSPPYRILVVEQAEPPSPVQAALSSQDYDVRPATSGAEALDALRAGEFDLVLVDFDAPDVGGTRFIASARPISSAPILVVTTRSAKDEKIAAFDAGASDYVVKPFDAEELAARVRAALRWRRLDAAGARPAGLQIDLSARRAVRDGRAVRLSARECALLQILADADGRVVPTEEIVSQVWGAGSEADEQHARVLVWQVRRKIEPDPASPRFVISEPTVGYRLRLAGLEP